jgi:hypothetical protein
MCGKATVVEAGVRHLCETCREEELRLYARVRSLLREYDGIKLTIQDAAEMLKEDEKKISHLVNSGYFQLVARVLRAGDDD